LTEDHLIHLSEVLQLLE